MIFFKIVFFFTSSDMPALIDTVELQEEGYQDVYVSAVEDPGLFYVQLSTSLNRFASIDLLSSYRLNKMMKRLSLLCDVDRTQSHTSFNINIVS